MQGSREIFDDRDHVREHGALDSDRVVTLTPLLESVRGDGYRWASLDVVDLDPPAVFPPSGRTE